MQIQESISNFQAPATETISLTKANVRQYIRKFFEVSKKGCTSDTYASALENFSLWVYFQDVNEITFATIEDYSNNYLQTTKSNATARLYLTAVRRFLRFFAKVTGTQDIGLLVDGIKAQQRETHHHKPLTDDQERNLLTAVQRGIAKNQSPTQQERNSRNVAIIRLLTKLGLRTIEVARLNLEDIDTSSDVPALHILGKGNKIRTLAIPANTFKALSEYVSTYRKDAEPDEPVFVNISRDSNATGERLTTRSISRIVREHLDAIGVESNNRQYTAHSLRTTCACRVYRTTSNIIDVQKVLGHSDPKTSEIYAHDEMYRDELKKSVLHLID